MKKKLFSFIVLLFAGYPLLAQFGAHAGVTFSSDKIKYEGISMIMSDRTAFTGGLFYRKMLSEKFSFQPEINFLPRGGELTIEMSFDEFEFGVKQEYVMNYIEVPLYFLYNSGKEKGLYAGLGPSFNFGLSGKLKYDAWGGR